MNDITNTVLYVNFKLPQAGEDASGEERVAASNYR